MNALVGNCSCVPGQYECGNCRRKRRAEAYRRLTPEQKAYDSHVDPLGAYHTDFPSGCSCHISAPCSYCVGYDPDANAEHEPRREAP